MTLAPRAGLAAIPAEKAPAKPAVRAHRPTADPISAVRAEERLRTCHLACGRHSLEWQTPGRTPGRVRSPLTGVANARVLLRVWHDLLLLVVLRVSRRTQSPQLGEIPGPGFCDSGYASAQNDEGQVGLRDAERRDAQNDE